MKKYLIAGSVGVIVLLAAGAYWFLYAASHDSTKPTRIEKRYELQGTLTRGTADMKKGGWYFEYQDPDGTHVIPILFSEISVCEWQTSSGRCKPSTFIEGRDAFIKGVDVDGAIGVTHLTFTEPPPAAE